jgi:cation/acetate symporter
VLKEENVAQLVGLTFGIAASTFAPVLLMTVWWTRYTRQGVVATFVVGLVVSMVYTFAKYSGMESLLGLPVLVNPALYGVPAAFAAGIIASLLTKDVGAVDHFMHMAHDRDGSDRNGSVAGPS